MQTLLEQGQAAHPRHGQEPLSFQTGTSAASESSGMFVPGTTAGNSRKDPDPGLRACPGWQGHIWRPCRWISAPAWDVFSHKPCQDKRCHTKSAIGIWSRIRAWSEMGSGCTRVDIEKISSVKGLPSSGTAAQSGDTIPGGI